jgi:hypothetical protein
MKDDWKKKMKIDFEEDGWWWVRIIDYGCLFWSGNNEGFCCWCCESMKEKRKKEKDFEESFICILKKWERSECWRDLLILWSCLYRLIISFRIHPSIMLFSVKTKNGFKRRRSNYYSSWVYDTCCFIQSLSSSPISSSFFRQMFLNAFRSMHSERPLKNMEE